MEQTVGFIRTRVVLAWTIRRDEKRRYSSSSSVETTHADTSLLRVVMRGPVASLAYQE